MAIDYTTALQNLNPEAQRPLLNAPEARISNESIASVIGSAMQGNSLTTYTFPFDYSDRFFVIMQGQLRTTLLNGVSNSYGDFNTMYRLPFPTIIQDTHDIKYDHNFNWMSLIGSAISSIPGGGRVTGVLGQVGAGITGLGYAVNSFKAVTLSVPNFRTFSLEFRLFPKTRAESDMIQRMVIALKTNMHPELTLGNLVFEFPRIFMMWFNTGNEYLYKFKPCVINALQVNYQGDNPIPTFYRNEENLAIPEGVILRMSCIELELWHRANFENSTAPSGLYNSNPLSAISGTPSTGFSTISGYPGVATGGQT